MLETKGPSMMIFMRLRVHMWIHSVRCRLPYISILYFECIKQTEIKKQTDADIMYGNTLLPVTNTSGVLHCWILIQ